MDGIIDFIPSTLFDESNLESVRVHSLHTADIPSARAVAPRNALPGHYFLGKTYDVVNGSETPHPSSFISDLIDRPKLKWKEYYLAGHTYMAPEILADAGGIHHGSVQIIESNKTEEYAQQLGGSVEAKASFGLFSGSLHSSFDTSESRYSNRRFGSAMDNYQQYSLHALEDEQLYPHLRPTVQNLLNSADPAEIIETLGTHYIAGAIFGGRAQASYTIDTNRYQSNMSISATIKAAYSYGIGKISGSAKTEYEQSRTSWEQSTSRRVQVVGGNERYARSILDGEYDRWLDSLEQTPAAVAFSGRGLRGIWHLAQHPDRSQAIKAAALKHIQGYQLLGYTPKLPLRAGDTLAFITADGSLISRHDRADFRLRSIGTPQSHSVFVVASTDNGAFTLKASNGNLLGHYYTNDLWVYDNTVNAYKWWVLEETNEGRFHIRNRRTNTYWHLPNAGKEIKLSAKTLARNLEFDVLVYGPKLG